MESIGLAPYLQMFGREGEKLVHWNEDLFKHKKSTVFIDRVTYYHEMEGWLRRDLMIF